MDEIFLTAVAGNSQRLDGGAMFGNAPKALWTRFFVPDVENRISLACRALLVESGDRKILLETGIGVFFAPELRSRFGVVEEDHVLLRSLRELGLQPDDITDVILSHLHFDHAGGLLAPYSANEPRRLLFSKARYVVSQSALARAEHPHVRDRASFIPELQGLLRDSGRLQVLADGVERDPSLPGLRFHYSSGHTPGLLLTEVQGPSPDRAVVFAGDLVPGTAWVHLPMTMGYDRYPELLIDEKTALLGDLSARHTWLFYTHDSEIAMSRVARNSDGRMTPVEPQRQVVRMPL